MKIIFIFLFSIFFPNISAANVNLIINNYWNTDNYEDVKKYVGEAEELLVKKDLSSKDRIKLSLMIVDYNIYEENYKKSYEILSKIKPILKNYKYLNLEDDFAFFNFYLGVSSWNLFGCERSKDYFSEAINLFKKDESFLYDELLSLFYIVDCDLETGFFQKSILNLNYILKITQNKKEDFNQFYEDALYKLSEIYEIKGEFKKSITYINKIILNNTDDKKLFDLYKHISYLNLWANDNHHATKALMKSLHHLKEINKISQAELNIEYLDLSKHFIELKNYQKAEELINKVKLQLHDKDDFLFIQNFSLKKAQILIFYKEIDQAKNLLINILNEYETLILKTKNLRKIGKDNAIILNDLHLNFTNLGLFSEAEKSAILALKISKIYVSATDDFYYAVLGNLGLFYRESLLPEKSINLLKPAINDMISLYGNDFFGLSHIYINLGSAYMDLENIKEALEYYRLALDVDEKVYGSLSEDTISSRNNLAHVQALNGQYDTALENYKLNYRIYLKNDLNPNPLLFNNLALAYSDVDDKQNAHKMHLKAYELSKKVLIPGHTDKTTIINNLITFYLQNNSYDTDLTFSKKLSDELIQNLYASLDDLRMEKSLTISNYFYGHHKASLTPFLVYSRLYFKKLINLEEFEKTFWLESLQLNSFSLLDLSLQSVKLRGGLQKLNIRKFQDLSLDLEKLNKEYREIVLNNNDVGLAQNKEAIKLKSKINKFRQDNNIPSGFTSLGQKTLQSQIHDEKVIVKFVSDDFYFYCILISKNNVIPIKYTRKINYYKNLFDQINLKKQNFDFKLFKDHSHKVYNEVFLPIEKYIKNKNELSFILEDFMFDLPPQVWVAKKTKNLFNSTPLYLVESNIITITPSLSILNKENKLNKNFNFKFVGVGYPSQKDGKEKIIQKVHASYASRGLKINEDKIISTFAPLPNTKVELEYFSKKLSPLGKTKLMISDDATEFKIKNLSALSEAEIISFSTHALINNELNNDNEPSLILTPDYQNDGFLTSSEIMYLKINARLVILSACNTASGFDNSSLGLTGLVNSFFYSGAEKVLATSWKVNDKSTMIFNKYFADNMIDKSDIKKSMNSAIIKMINDSDYSNPHFWAAFSLISR